MVLSSDHLTGATGKSPTVTLSKNGGAFGSPAGLISEIGNGWYSVAGNATDENTLGPLLLHAAAVACDPTDENYPVVSYNPQSTALGLTGVGVVLPAIPANWITAAGITASAFNGKGDWFTPAGYAVAPPWYTTTTIGAVSSTGVPLSNLMAIKANLLQLIAAELSYQVTNGPKPSYSIGGQNVSWNEWYSGMMGNVAGLNELIQVESMLAGPLEYVTQGV